MTEHLIGFEGLGISPFSVDPVAFRIGDFNIYWYAIIITCGLILAVVFAMWQARRFDLTADHVLDVLIWGLPIGVICARAYYVAFTLGEYDSFFEMINIRNGGLAIYGGVIGGFLTAWIYCRIKKLPFLALFDLASLGFMIGQSVGRWGNFINAEAYGSATDLPWGMTINGAGPYHPTFLYESLWNVAGFLLLFFIMVKRKKHHGEICFLYFAWYGFGRFWIEGLRTDSLYLPGDVIRVSQLLAAIFFLAGVVLFLLCRKGILDRRAEHRAEKKAKKEAYQPIYKPLLSGKQPEALTEGDPDAELPEAEQNTDNGKEESDE